MIYEIQQGITTTITYQVEAAEGISKNELCEIIRSSELEIQHDGFSRSDFCDALSDFDNAFVYSKNGEEVFPPD